MSVDTLLDSMLQFPTFPQENLAARENMDLKEVGTPCTRIRAGRRSRKSFKGQAPSLS
jgi:hypothetical protein